MYAAAGGASIANRRKQKRLQLNNRKAEAAPLRIKTGGASGTGAGAGAGSGTGSKFARPHVIPPPPAPPPAPSAPIAFHSSVDRRRRVERCQQLAPPVSPIIQFPISPPPLSLESSNSLTTATSHNCPKKSNNFPFPPVLDLRVSPSTSELQCGGQGPGKAAWQGCSNRPGSSLPLTPISPHECRGDGYKTKQCEAHRRWMKRNRIRDASYCYGSSGEDEDDDENGMRARRGEVSAAVNTVLYAGLGTTALGLVISFVGTGEKGFLSPELRLVGPSLLCAGLLCCLFRVLLCLCLCHCECRKRSKKIDKKCKGKSKTKSSTTAKSSSGQTTLLPIHQPTNCKQSVAERTKGHELLLSPAQLP